MFTRWGDLVYRFRFAVIAVVGAAMLALGAYGTGLGDRLTQSGWFDPGSESVQGAEIADEAFGRDHMADVIVMYNAPEGKTIDDPEFQQKIVDNLSTAVAEHPDHIDKINGTYWKVGDAPAVPSVFGSKDKKHAFASIAIVGDNDTVIMTNYRAVQDAFYIPGVDVEVSGLQPLAVTLTDTMDHDSKRMEMLAFPAVAVLLFFIFGGIVAAALPLIIGGLTIIGATGLVMGLTNFTEVNIFVGGVVSMIGLGLAIDYGLFIVSRFREELAEGYDTRVAVRRSVMTAGRTVVFSATMIIASLGGILIFPQGFLRSVAYGTIAAVSLAALTAITILPAMLGILGPRVDMLGLKRFRKTKTAEQVENGFWGNTTRWVMRHPLKIAIPITIGLLLLIIPVKNLAFGGINEKYLPPDNSTRTSLEHFYEVFPQKKTDPIQLVFVGENTTAIGQIRKEASQAPGLAGPFDVPTNPPNNSEVYRTSATLIDPTGDVGPTIDYLRSIEVPDGITMYVTGQPALMADSINTLLDLMPWMILLVLVTTTVLMFLTFGSLVLPLKAALMSALGLGSTLGILTWIFVDGNGAGLLNFTPQPISAPVLMLIIAIIYGLSTDYEVFLLSRMVEARAQGASTTEAVRIGTAQTGRIITAAALILLVVTGAFAFSDMVMMQYIAYGMIAALFLDATILRMLLVPAIMKLLGDDCWWAPKWMKRIQEKIGLGEPILDDERPQQGAVVDLVKTTPITDPPTMQMTAVPDTKLAKTPRRPRTVAEIEAEAPTQRIDKVTEHTDTPEPVRARKPMSPDPTRPRASMLSGEPTQILPVVKPGDPEPGQAQPDSAPADTGDNGEQTQILPIVKPGTDPTKSAPTDPTSDTSEGPGTSAGSDSEPRAPHRLPRDPGGPNSGLGSPGPSSGPDNPGASSGLSNPGDPNSSLGNPGPNSNLGNPDGASSPLGDLGTSGLRGDPSGFSHSNSDAGRTPDLGSASSDAEGRGISEAHGDANIRFGGAGAASVDASGDTGFSLRDAGPGAATPSISVPGDNGFGVSPARGADSGGSEAVRGQGFVSDGVIGGGYSAEPTDDETGGAGAAPRGSERVQPPPGYTPPALGDGPAAPRVSPPVEPGGFGRATDEPRPSIVTPTRPSIVNTPPPSVATPPPSIVNTPPPTPRTAAPQPRPADSPAGGTFSGFTPLSTPTDAPHESGNAPIRPSGEPHPDNAPHGSGDSPIRQSGEPYPNSPPHESSEAPTRPSSEAYPGPRQPDSRSNGSVPPRTDLTATPGAHRADLRTDATPDVASASGLPAESNIAHPRSGSDPYSPNDAGAHSPGEPEATSARSVFGTPVPVEPRDPAWNNPVDPNTPSAFGNGTGDPSAPTAFTVPDADGPRFTPVIPSSDSPTTAPVPPSAGLGHGEFTPNPPLHDADSQTDADTERGDVAPNPPLHHADSQTGDVAPNPAVTPQSLHPLSDTGREESTAPRHPANTVRPQVAPPGFTAVTGDETAQHRDAASPVESAPGQEERRSSTGLPAHTSDRPGTTDPAGLADRSGTMSAPAPRPSAVHDPSTAEQSRTMADRATSGQSHTADDGGTSGPQAADEPGTAGEQRGAAGQWRAPSGFTAVPNPAAATPDPSSEQSSSTEGTSVADDSSAIDRSTATDADSTGNGSTPAEPAEPHADNRNEIENWMAQLRSSRRGGAADEGRHSGDEGRTVSVNELLRRRNDETE
ncbi:MMPL family transporter [Nocardia halotolerans]|uniref:MMPL family transporter n=1 Tax=Nocardia halotolerans TaxID=1755878 RepID=A0ABV8VDG9_9NOCA